MGLAQYLQQKFLNEFRLILSMIIIFAVVFLAFPSVLLDFVAFYGLMETNSGSEIFICVN